MAPPGERPASPPGFGAGVSSVIAGFGTIARTPSLWPWALVPVLVLLLLEGAVVALAATVARPFVESLLPAASGNWGKVGVGAVGWLTTAALAVVGWFVAVPL